MSYQHAPPPPLPPPKPGSQEVSRRSTPLGASNLLSHPLLDTFRTKNGDTDELHLGFPTYGQLVHDPGNDWLPPGLEDKSCVVSLLPKRNVQFIDMRSTESKISQRY